MLLRDALDWYMLSLQEHVARGDRLVPSRFSLGVDVFDSAFNGLLRGERTLVTGGSHSGKTALLVAAALANAVRARRPTLFIGFRSTPADLAQRLLCAVAGVMPMRMRGGWITQPQWDAVQEARAVLAAAPLWVVGPPFHATSLGEVLAETGGRAELLLLDDADAGMREWPLDDAVFEERAALVTHTPGWSRFGGGFDQLLRLDRQRFRVRMRRIWPNGGLMTYATLLPSGVLADGDPGDAP